MSEIINIVGSGLAGSITAHVLEKAGHEVRVFDDNDINSASRASSNLFITHWLKRFSQRQATRGIEIIEELFEGKIDQPFVKGMAYAMKVKHLAQRHVIYKKVVQERVTAVTQEGVETIAAQYPGRTVVCTGYRAGELLRGMEVAVKVGHCCLFSGVLPKGVSRLAIISPYRHEKLYQFEPETIYYSDSVALKPETYLERREELRKTTQERARKHIGEDLELKGMLVGYRPFLKGFDFGRLDRIGANVWSINGGGKNGLIAYANLANQLRTQL